MTMTPIEALFSSPQYSLPTTEKRWRLLDVLNTLTDHHANRCSEYGRIIGRLHGARRKADNLAEVPYLPVGLFKRMRLKSISETEVFKVLRSSGTTSGQTSWIILDRETAGLQSSALSRIMTALLGQARRRMLIIDSPDVVRDRTALTARGAGILGMSTFGRDHHYALRPDMTFDEEGTRTWLQRDPTADLFLFGFTYMVWSYFFQAISPGSIDLSRGVLVHGGGWKKMSDAAVSRDEFRTAIEDRTGLTRVHDYYGMVEQIGSIFVECEYGFLHTPNFADVLIRDPESWSAQERGKTGIIQVLSMLPRSYPGHSLLTEDLGTEVGEDDCLCGRYGTYFKVQGRVPKTIARGCSDTHMHTVVEGTR